MVNFNHHYFKLEQDVEDVNYIYAYGSPKYKNEDYERVFN